MDVLNCALDPNRLCCLKDTFDGCTGKLTKVSASDVSDLIIVWTSFTWPR